MVSIWWKRACADIRVVIIAQMCLAYGGVPGGQGKLDDSHALASAKCQVSTFRASEVMRASLSFVLLVSMSFAAWISTIGS